MYIKHRLIKPKSTEYREYQTSIASSASKRSTLVVLPTGLGKTVVALLVIAERLKEKNGEKILFLAPTKPLVAQHESFLKKHLEVDESTIVSFTGEIFPSKRKELWRKGSIIISTPQVIENDIISNRVDLSQVSLIVFDEAHRAVGEYSYVFVADSYKKNRNEDRLTLGITASPGSDVDKILEVCKNLEIKNIEIRTKHDPDVRAYVYDMEIQWKRVEMPDEFNRVITLLRQALSIRLKALKEGKVLDTASVSMISRRRLLEVQSRIQSAIKERKKDRDVLFALATIQNEALKIYHAIELLQTQGVNTLKSFFDRILNEAKSRGGSRASKRIINDQKVIEAVAYLNSINIEHPKIRYVADIVKDQFKKKPDSRVIVFTHYRDTSIKVKEALERENLIKPVRFIGQATKGEDRGMKQKEQVEVIDNFKRGIYNTLIATSVAEEGIDIPSTDMVVFYEPVPSEIRTIQRRGRTARRMPGKVVILITKNTPDEAYYWASLRKEKRMRRELEYLRKEIKSRIGKDTFSTVNIVKQSQLNDFQRNNDNNNKIKLIVDNREYRSLVVRKLINREIEVEAKQLSVGDYIVSSRVGVERKTTEDFLESMIKGKLFRQIMELRDAYARPLLIIEGKDLFTKRNIGQSAIFGSLVSIIVDYGIPILTTRDETETAELLTVMAKREQKQGKKDISIRGEKKGMSLHERQQFIVEGLPSISSVLARRLLKHFKSIKNIANASEEDLFQVPGIGKITAKEIVEILTAPYLEK